MLAPFRYTVLNVKRDDARSITIKETLMRCLCLCGVIAVALAGCGDPSSDPPEPAPAEQSASAEPANESASDEQPKSMADKVELEICSYEELQQRIAGYTGKIVVVDYWSTQCPPCMKEFPHLVELSRKYPAEQVVCLSASLDFEDFGDNTVESARERALEFLTEKQATLENVIINEDSISVLDEKLGTGIPVVFVYDTDGSQNARFDESLGRPFTYEKDVNPLVEQLVAERFPTAE